MCERMELAFMLADKHMSGGSSRHGESDRCAAGVALHCHCQPNCMLIRGSMDLGLACQEHQAMAFVKWRQQN